MLARREHSRAELARKLAGRAESSAALDALLDTLQERKLLSDERYAELRVHQLSRKFGVARVLHDLRGKGIEGEAAERSVAGLREDEIARASEILRRKYRSPIANREDWSRRARFLHGRGFSSEVIRRALDAPAPDDD